MTRIVKKCRDNPCPLSPLLSAHGYALATTVSWIYNCEQSATRSLWDNIIKSE
jgi:hypothetical protein